MLPCVSVTHVLPPCQGSRWMPAKQRHTGSGQWNCAPEPHSTWPSLSGMALLQLILISMWPKQGVPFLDANWEMLLFGATCCQLNAGRWCVQVCQDTVPPQNHSHLGYRVWHMLTPKRSKSGELWLFELSLNPKGTQGRRDIGEIAKSSSECLDPLPPCAFCCRKSDEIWTAAPGLRGTNATQGPTIKRPCL